jgi:hypothetical protein
LARGKTLNGKRNEWRWVLLVVYVAPVLQYIFNGSIVLWMYSSTSVPQTQWNK